MRNQAYEAIVIGSGATGGVAALTLAEAGIKVLVIEAGPNYSPQKALGSEPCNTFRRFSSLVTREYGQQIQHPGFWKANPLLFAKADENPYISPTEHPYIWTQGRQVGGRSLTWGGITLRLSNQNFSAAEIDGHGFNWPIKHKELDIHYSALEKSFGVHGNRDGIKELPDGQFIEPLPFTESEQFFAKKIESNFECKVINSRGFGPHKATDESPWPKSSSPGSTLMKAIQTGNVEILSGHIVEKIVLNKQHDKATGLLALNTKDGCRRLLKSELIVLCSSTIQTLKILLNSTESNSEDGFIEPSGKLGKNLMDHISTCRFFSLPANNDFQIDDPLSSTGLSGAGSFLIPNGEKICSNVSPNFLRGFGLWGAINRFKIPQILQKDRDSVIGFLIGHGEVLSNESNMVTLSSKTDKWGIPIPIIDCCWHKNEMKMVSNMQSTIKELISTAGGEIVSLQNLINLPFLNTILSRSIALKDSAPPPGYYIHEVGGAPMGDNEKFSVVDPINRLWRCSNVLVVDGACWPSSGWQSPTLTMMAITRRACLEAIKPHNK